MEILTLLLLYLISQNPDFPDCVKPIMGKLQHSEDMLKFLNDLSNFSDIFSPFSPPKKEENRPNGCPPRPAPPPPPKKADGTNKTDETDNADDTGKNGADCKQPPRGEEKPQSPTSGIADEFIQQCLDRYFKNRK